MHTRKQLKEGNTERFQVDLGTHFPFCARWRVAPRHCMLSSMGHARWCIECHMSDAASTSHVACHMSASCPHVDIHHAETAHNFANKLTRSFVRSHIAHVTMDSLHACTSRTQHHILAHSTHSRLYAYPHMRIHARAQACIHVRTHARFQDAERAEKIAAKKAKDE